MWTSVLKMTALFIVCAFDKVIAVIKLWKWGRGGSVGRYEYIFDVF